MKIVLCHNYYQIPGGEDRVFEDECELLRSRGHNVHVVTKHNRDLHGSRRTTLLRNAVWNAGTFSELNRIAHDIQPDIAHFTNLFPIFSPAAYWAFQKNRIPVVQSLHNYRMICPGSLLMRKERFCQKCVGKKFAWPGVVHGCYRKSRVLTAVAAASNAFHRTIGTWDSKVDRYIALTEFSREQFVKGGIPEGKLVVKPNFVLRQSEFRESSDSNYSIYVGRLSHEKGVGVLLDAWKDIDPSIHLKIAGSGPLESAVRKADASSPNIQFLGELQHADVMQQIANARVAIVPSVSVETFGRVVIEAYCVGTPVIASDIGAIAENVCHGETGWLVKPNDASAIVKSVRSMFADNGEAERMGQVAIRRYQEKYSTNANYDQLVSIYQDVIDRKRRLLAGVTEQPAALVSLDSAVVGTGPGAAIRGRQRQVATSNQQAEIANAVKDGWPGKVSLFGLKVSVTDYSSAVASVQKAVVDGQPASISCHAAHAIVEFTSSKKLTRRLNEFEMITPDGQPVRWAMNLLHGAGLRERVYGPELMLRVCRMAEANSYPVFLYGGSSETLRSLQENLRTTFPDLEIAGAISPPFRELTPEEAGDFVDQINSSGARILFVGLGCPKQDLFVSTHRQRFKPVQICVGAAFDFHAGNKPFAPGWMQRTGLEWLFRLCCEPKRLFVRYLTTNPVFIFRVVKQLLIGTRDIKSR